MNIFKNTRYVFIFIFFFLFSFSIYAGNIEKGLDFFQKKQYEKAMPYLEESHAITDPRVQAALGLMSRDGLGVEKDHQKAFHLFLESARQNNPRGQFGLGTMYYKGNFVKKDKEKAFKWTRYAA